MEELTVAPKHLCCSCKKLLRTPIQTYCGHRYCNFCFENTVSREDNSYCQACSEEEDGKVSLLSREEMFSDKAILRELKVVNLSCQNAGCEWKGSYAEYDQDHADSCPFERITCINTGCGVIICRGDLVDHLSDACGMRAVQCPYCTDKLPYKDLQEHIDDCERAPVKCKYCDKEDIPRVSLADHLHVETGDCRKRVIPCKYEQVGCKEMIEVHQYEEHGKRHTAEHLQLLLETVVPLTNSVNEVKEQNRHEGLKREIEKHQQYIDELTITSELLKTEIAKINAAMKPDRQITTLPQSLITNFEEQGKLVKRLSTRSKVIETKLSTCEQVIGTLNSQLQQNAEAVKKLATQRRRDRELIDSLERKIRAQDRTISLKDETLVEHNLRIQSLELASYDGITVWKIADFGRKRGEAISDKTLSFYSPCFFTSRHGYKLCARIYLNGDGTGKGNHASLFFAIMKGPFDALLKWPFRQKVTLLWVDQNSREHVVDAFRPEPTSSSFKRPTQDMNVASGCPLFMSLSMLDSPRHAFVKDDTAFVKIIVDTSDIA